MLYSLSKLYDTKVLNRNKVINEEIEFSQEHNDSDKIVKILSQALKQIIEIGDNANEINEELIDHIRSISVGALIDSGIEKD